MLDTSAEHTLSGNIISWWIIMRRSISILLWLILIVVLSAIEVYGYVLKDPGIPDGEQIIWRVTRDGKPTRPSIITWRTGDIDGKPVYEITTDAGE